jgi:general secretion pathway protein K
MAAPLSGRRLSAHRRAPASQRGFALVTVLWAAMILAVIAASIIATGRTETRLAHTRYASAQLDAVADGAINIAILRMLDPSSTAHPPVDATPFTIEFAGHAVAMTAQDESGKVDINMAQEGLLRRLLVTVGVDGLAAQALTDKILDWREAAIGRRLNGAKAEDYRDAGFAYGPRNGPFESVDELQLVMGMNAPLFERIAPSLTIYSQTPWVDPAFAPIDVLAALAGLGAPSVAETLNARAIGKHNAIMFGHAFTISARIDDGLRVAKSAIIRLTGSPQTPVVVYRWR